MTTTQKDLANDIAERHKLTKKAANEIVSELFDTIKDTVSQGDEVAIHGFGKFKAKATAAKKGNNPQTDKPVNIPAGRKVKFTVSKMFKDAL